MMEHKEQGMAVQTERPCPVFSFVVEKMRTPEYETALQAWKEAVHRHSPHPDSISQQIGCLNDSGRL